jgi:purine nucleoside permease
MRHRLIAAGLFSCLAYLASFTAQAAAAEPIKVKVFIAAMFEIGQNSGDRAVKGALKPVYCNDDGVCGSVLGMGKVNSSASMQAILLDPAFDFSKSYYILSGVAGTPPSRGTIGDVSWATWLVDYDLGHRWAPEEGKPGEPVFMPRKGYEDYRVFKLNPDLVAAAMHLGSKVELRDSQEAQNYRMRYPDKAAQAKPSLKTGTHMTGDTFFHGPGLSKEAQYIVHLYGADDYLVTEMEAAAITLVIKRQFGTDRIASLRGAVNFDQGNPNETTLQHLDPAPGQTAGGFAETVQNIYLVGSPLVDDIVAHWDKWEAGVPKAD